MADCDGVYRVSSPWFVCGVEVHDGMLTRAAPVLAWMVAWQHGRWSLARLLAYSAQHGWTVEQLVPDLTGIRVERV